MLLGIDIGTTHIKVGQYTQDGTLLAHRKALTPKATLEGLEHYLTQELWSTTANLIKEVLANSNRPVEALAVAGMGEAGLFLSKQGEAIYPIIPWNDLRAEHLCQRLSEDLNADAWFSKTGVYPNPIHSIFKWLWLKENEPDVFKQAAVWLSTIGFVRYKLTGAMHMERSQAARTMAYDVKEACWSQELLELASIPNTLVPELVYGTDSVGTISSEASALTNLKEGTPVYAGGHDHICATLACGVLDSSIALDSLGTAEGLTFAVAGSPNPSQSAGFAVGPHVIKEHSYLLGGIYSSGGAVAWVKELFGLDYDDLVALAQSVNVGEAPLFVPHFYGAAPPFNKANAKAAFLQVEPHHTKAHFVRAVFEGVAFEIKRHSEVYEHLVGQSLKQFRAVGSVAENDFWMHLRSSILGKSIVLSQHADMVTLGVALLAGLGVGVYSSPQEAVKETYQSGKQFLVDSALHKHYESIYQTYTMLLK